MKHTHADKLERWLGAAQVKAISQHYGKFYYPIALHGVPGNVRVLQLNLVSGVHVRRNRTRRTAAHCENESSRNRQRNTPDHSKRNATKHRQHQPPNQRSQ